MQVQNYTIEDNLKKIIDVTYINKTSIFFNKSKNFMIKLFILKFKIDDILKSFSRKM